MGNAGQTRAAYRAGYGLANQSSAGLGQCRVLNDATLLWVLVTTRGGALCPLAVFSSRTV